MLPQAPNHGDSESTDKRGADSIRDPAARGGRSFQFATSPPSIAPPDATAVLNHCAIDCFDLALADVGLANDYVLRQVLHDYFPWATTTTMARFHQSADDVPNGLSIPHWSWDGLQV